MSKKKTGTLIAALLLLMVILVAAYFIFFSASGWESYAKTDEYISVCDYQSVIREGQEQSKSRDDIWAEIIAYSETKKYPQKELKELKEENLKNYTDLANNSGYDDVNEFLEKEMSLTPEQFDENSEFFCKHKITETLVLYRIANLEGIEVTEEAYAEYLDGLMQLNSFTDESFRELYGKSFREYSDEVGMKETYLLEQVKAKLFA